MRILKPVSILVLLVASLLLTGCSGSTPQGCSAAKPVMDSYYAELNTLVEHFADKTVTQVMRDDFMKTRTETSVQLHDLAVNGNLDSKELVSALTKLADALSLSPDAKGAAAATAEAATGLDTLCSFSRPS